MTESKKDFNGSFSIRVKLHGKDKNQELYSIFACGENNKKYGTLCFNIDLIDHRSYIEVLKVDEQLRNEGLGTLLLQTYAYLQRSYPSEITFRPHSNRKITQLFQKFGFSIVPFNDPQCPDFIKMVKNNKFSNKFLN